MRAIGDLISKITQKRNLTSTNEITQTMLNSPEIKQFLAVNKDQVDLEIIKNSIPNLFEFYNQIEHPNQVMAGYQPELFLNGKVIDVRYTPTKQKLAHDQKRQIQANLKLIDLPTRLHDVRLSEIEIDTGRQEVLQKISEFLAKYQKDIHQKGLYLSGDFGIGKTYILAGLANQVAKSGKKVIFLHVPTFIAGLSQHFQDNSLHDEIKRVADCDLLILDDIGAETLSQWSRDDVLGVILQARMDNMLPTFFSSNFDLDTLQSHFAETKSSVDEVKAARLMQRVRFLAQEVIVSGPNRRKI